jgi:predicted ArsR family transcriptional regulator
MSRPDEKDIVVLQGVLNSKSIREIADKLEIQPSAVYRRLRTLEGKSGTQFAKIPFVSSPPYKGAARSRRLTQAGFDWLQESGFLKYEF